MLFELFLTTFGRENTVRTLCVLSLHVKKINLKSRKETNRELISYAGMGAQFLVSIGIGIFIGMKLDEWLHFSIPLLVWIMPLLIIIGLIIKIIKDTSKK